ncbi:troponin cardiac muscle isoforms-like protein [Labeo rohita]|uniref:Troponin cardiac muscle isoforms-like protein n=1 Tax=Labeo rohita TaxID=84645 RepID=A0A498MYQ5_LABRO|nr:troponin cardiac muscle isoforms-like protein [Labeo rohita]
MLWSWYVLSQTADTCTPRALCESWTRTLILSVAESYGDKSEKRCSGRQRIEATITKKEDPAPVTEAEEPKESSEKDDKPEEEDKPQRSQLREQESTEEKPKEPAVPNEEESNIETKEQTNADLASADVEKKEVEDESQISSKEPTKEDQIEAEVKVEPATSQIEEEKLVEKEEPVKKPEEKPVEVKSEIQDEAPAKKEDEKLLKEQEKPTVTVEETPKKSIREVEAKTKTPKKEEEKPQLKKAVEEKPSTPKKKVEEKPVTPKKEVEEKPKWKKEAEETKAKAEEKVKSKKEEVVEEKPKPSFVRDKLKVSTKPQDVADSTAKAKKPEKTLRQRLICHFVIYSICIPKESQNEYKDIFPSRFSPTSLRSPETEKQDPIAKLEAERKLQELKRRRNETDSEIGEKAEFLNKSALKSPVKTSHTPLVCKIGNRLEQYTSAVQTKEVTKSPKSPVDVPGAEGMRSIKIDDSKSKPKYLSNIQAPKIPEGEKVDFDDIQKKRQEKDLAELQSLIEAHFLQRQKDEEELIALVNRIEEKERKEQEEQRKKQDEDAKKKKALTNMTHQYGGIQQRGEGRKGAKKQTEREKKKKILAERRKPLTVDHLSDDKLKDKATELWQWLMQLEAEKYDLNERLKRQKYDINQLLARVQDHQSAKGRGKGKMGGRLR